LRRAFGRNLTGIALIFELPDSSLFLCQFRCQPLGLGRNRLKSFHRFAHVGNIGRTLRQLFNCQQALGGFRFLQNDSSKVAQDSEPSKLMEMNSKKNVGNSRR
jgi:hypothetical protein